MKFKIKQCEENNEEIIEVSLRMYRDKFPQLCINDIPILAITGNGRIHIHDNSPSERMELKRLGFFLTGNHNDKIEIITGNISFK